MRVIVRVGVGLVAAALIAIPAPAVADVHYPAGPYARAASDCTGALKAPTTVVLQGFASSGAAHTTMNDETAWSAVAPETGGAKLQMSDVPNGNLRCRPEANGLQSPTSGGGYRTYTRIWENPTSNVVAASPVRTHQTENSNCQGANGGGKWVANADGYTNGAYDFALAFQTTVYSGAYPIQAVNWGNSNSIVQCDGSTVASNGSVYIIRPKDDFGLHEGFKRALLRYDAPIPGTKTIANCTDQPVPKSYGAIKQAVINDLQQEGVTTVRLGVNWASVAPCSGASRGQWVWDEWDATVPQLANAGIKPILLVSGAPPKGPDASDPQWADPNCDSPPARVVNTVSGSGGLGNWQNFVEDVASNYGDQIKGIEVWNEENSKNFWGGCEPDPSTYVKFLNRAKLGVANSTHPGVKLVMGGVYPWASTTQANGWRWQSYWDSVFADPNWSAGNVDAIGLHPYRIPSERNASPEVDPVTAATDKIQAALDRLDQFQLNKPAWVTEVGTTTVDNSSGSGAYVGPDPWVQAFADWNIYDAVRNMGVPVTVMYRMVDDPNASNPTDRGFGVIDQYLNEKPAYCLLRQERGGPLC